ncbi:MAG TPA: 16S rRNA (cytidine(1402)-2'-O)-methyltransferase [Terriglobales bacterium]|nr:16S rRNA (cytidine(1402)-2'-O)-methyltransferase [Terriglobales bacterium]
MAGTLYLVATPIGNLEDFSPRAQRVLREVAAIACEDTRQTRKLLARFAIATPLVSYHEHNERRRAPELAARLAAGESLALVSDAGTPLLSDPGHRLVQAALAAGAVITPIPGPAALAAALVASGLAAAPFYFAGFLPAAPGARRKVLASWRNRGETIVFYEAPHRLIASLRDAAAELGGERQLALARELTKLHEEFFRGTIAEALRHLEAAPPRGEFTVVLAPAPAGESGAPAPLSEPPSVLRMRELLAAGLSQRDALKQAARETGQPRATVYREWQSAGRSRS